MPLLFLELGSQSTKTVRWIVCFAFEALILPEELFSNSHSPDGPAALALGSRFGGDAELKRLELPWSMPGDMIPSFDSNLRSLDSAGFARDLGLSGSIFRLESL